MNDFCVHKTDKILYVKSGEIHELIDYNIMTDDEKNIYPLVFSSTDNELIEDSTDIYIVIKKIEDLKNYNLFNKTKNITIELFDIVLFIPKNTAFCKDCLYTRYVEGISISLKQSLFNKSEIESMIINFERLKYVFSNENYNLSGEVRLFNKLTNVEETSTIRCFPNCLKGLNHFNNYSDTEENLSYKKLKNGYRIKDNVTLIDMVNRMSSVTSLEKLSNIDNVSWPVYGSTSSFREENIEYSYHGGKGFSDKSAQNSAIAESIERYSARNFKDDKEFFYSVDFMNKEKIKYLDPKVLKPDGKGIFQYSEDKFYFWVRGWELDADREEEILIPSNAVYFPYNKIENTFISQTTTGLSSGNSIHEALIQGILEIIERNSYGLTHKCMLPVVDILITNKSILKYINQLKNKEIICHFTLLSNNFGCYVVHCLLDNKKNSYPKYTHGSGAALDIDIAINRALSEALQMRVSQVISFQENSHKQNEASFNWGTGNKKYCSSFFNSKGNKKIKDSSLASLSHGNFKSDIEYINSILNKHDKKIYYVDISRKDTPLKTVRVIIPDMQDIYSQSLSTRLIQLGLKNELPMFS